MTSEPVLFHDNYLPVASAGKYRIGATQTVTGSGVAETFTLPTQQEFVVRAPRFALDPSFVHAVRPAPDSSGDFRRLLPHITLDRAILPWDRKLGATEDKRVPWLALLVFAEGELHGGSSPISTRTVKELLSGTEPDVLLPPISLSDVPDELKESGCHTIDVDGTLFAELVPRKAELPYLGHVRVRGAEGTGRFGLVISNRFPLDRTGQGVRYQTHLVSLEGLASYADGAPLPQGKKYLRLISLWSWSFTSRAKAGGDFSSLARALTIADPPSEPTKTNEHLALRMPLLTSSSTAAEQAARDRIAAGYLPVNLRTVSGESSFAWYRGPFVPYPPSGLPAKTGKYRASAEEALVYLEDYGVFDVSYAAAWTLGRTLALAKADLTAGVRQLSQTRSRAARLLMDLPEVPPATPELAAMLSPDAIRDQFDELGHPGLVRTLTEVFTPGSLPRGEEPVPMPTTAAPPQLPDLVTHLDAPEVRTALRAALLGLDAAEPAPAASAQYSAGSEASEAAETEAETAEDRAAASVLPSIDPWQVLAAVPFEHLVPHESMLPAGRIRFWYIDPDWVDVAVDGVLSTGISTSLDTRLTEHLRGDLVDRVGDHPRAGIFVRSPLISGWPALIVEAWQGDNPVAVRRRTTPAPDILLCLFDGVPDKVVLREPAQELSVGIDSELDPSGKGGRIDLRALKAARGVLIGQSLGQSFPPESDPAGITRFLRTTTSPAKPAVLNLAAGTKETALVPAMAEALRGLGQLTGELSPASFGLQLVNGSQQWTFRRGQENR
ncbi:hypothetical protein ATK36_0910 [Amycolatopsis sulphurea]|uniref:Uncharacterized protein n=1 Tax=Amycolatopsis sulphurea TaxID=76022 RepID=A0A2A9G3A6_9PSEU|nr:hypothetical protein [Amycolatopsis sulphurea]PFG57332.1 hypothetical protein ATK36_0910 [Amycolatopsis sulphurea]